MTSGGDVCLRPPLNRLSSFTMRDHVEGMDWWVATDRRGSPDRDMWLGRRSELRLAEPEWICPLGERPEWQRPDTAAATGGPPPNHLTTQPPL